MRLLLVAAAAALLVLPHPSHGKTEIQCRQKDRDIAIDGDSSEWGQALTLIKEAKLSCGLVNDGEYLFVAVVTSDRQVIRQIMLSGLYTWFDEQGKQAKNFGVYFPIGLQESGVPQEGGGHPGPQAGNPAGKPDSLTTAFFESAREFMLYSPIEEEWRRATVGKLGDAEAVAGYSNNTLVVEIKVPLLRREPGAYGVGAAPGSVIGMGLESPQIRMPRAGHQGPPGQSRPEGDDQGVERPGGGGGPPGMGGGGGSGGPPDRLAAADTVAARAAAKGEPKRPKR